MPIASSNLTFVLRVGLYMQEWNIDLADAVQTTGEISLTIGTCHPVCSHH